MGQFYHADHMQWSIFFSRRSLRNPLIFNPLQAPQSRAITAAFSLLAKDFLAMKNSRFTAEISQLQASSFHPALWIEGLRRKGCLVSPTNARIPSCPYSGNRCAAPLILIVCPFHAIFSKFWYRIDNSNITAF